MRIAWGTPFHPHSAIGQISRLVTDRLHERGHEVLIVRSEEVEHDAQIETTLPVCHWKTTDPVALARDFDAILLNFGDHYGFHAGAIDYIDRIPAIGIFHDFYLYNMFCGWISANGFDRDYYEQEVKRTYGPVSAMPTESAMHPAVIQKIAETTPMTEWVAARCCAALAHSGFYMHRLASSCPGPVDVAPLPARQPAVQPYQPVPGRALTVTTVGILNPNKCADIVIRALGASAKLRETAQYRLAGAVTDLERDRLTAIAEQVGFRGLHLLGAVDDGTLFEEMNRADVLCCLRRPVLEGASASAIEGMKTGRPVIVANAGFYAELPDDLVFKVEVDPEPVRAVLEELDSRPELRQRTGAHARDWAVSHFTADKYAIVVERLIEQFIRVRPLHELARRVGRELGALGLSPSGPRVQEIATEMYSLFTRSIEHETRWARP